MIGRLLLSALLLAMLGYALIAARRAPLVATLIGLAASAGIYFVWRPEAANQLAHMIGIGRGADLVLYIWVILSMLVVLNLHLRLRAQAELATRLARHLALLEASSATPPGKSLDN